ncbi:hypothetical protein HGRIS_001062 [Hohenbuehelia grisea]|uniref:PUM-HD domain-containing protein n=1 Tax=Hohenbuehelia grisea TaxID=104357 RepID=A0ABR3JPM7_9AGAR
MEDPSAPYHKTQLVSARFKHRRVRHLVIYALLDPTKSHHARRQANTCPKRRQEVAASCDQPTIPPHGGVSMPQLAHWKHDMYAGVPAPAIIHFQQGLDYTLPPAYYPQVMYPLPPMASSSTIPAMDRIHGMQMVPRLTEYYPAGFPITPTCQSVHGCRAKPMGRVRSHSLKEFRRSIEESWELKDILGHVVEFSGDQVGSRFIQAKIETATLNERKVIFDEIVPSSALQLAEDIFGNFVIQKLFEYGTPAQKQILANTMEGHIFKLSIGMYSCHVVQTAIKYILPDQQVAVIRELEPHVLECIKNVHGSYVIQELITLIKPVSSERPLFLSAFCAASLDLATDQSGCNVLQSYLNHLPESLTRPLIHRLLKHAVVLMRHRFGNYVIQFVLEHGKPQDRSLVCAKIQGQIMTMAQDEFASHVCKKALVCADANTRWLLIQQLFSPKDNNVSPILQLMKHEFGRYVLECAISLVEPEQRQALTRIVAPQVASMWFRPIASGEHLFLKWLLEKKCSTPSL